VSKPLGEFGGWLRVFLVISWVQLLYYLVGFLLFLSVALIAYGPAVDWATHKRLALGFLGMIRAAIMAYLYYLIIKMIKIRSSSVPGTIIRLMLLMFGVSLLYEGVGVPVSLWVEGKEWSEEMATGLRNDIVSAAALLAFWYFYFKTSGRVKSYYREDGYIFHDGGLTETPGSENTYKGGVNGWKMKAHPSFSWGITIVALLLLGTWWYVLRPVTDGLSPEDQRNEHNWKLVHEQALDFLESPYREGHYERVIYVEERALAFAEALGPDHPHVATSLEHLAYLYEQVGRHREAMESAHRAEKIRAKHR